MKKVCVQQALFLIDSLSKREQESIALPCIDEKANFIKSEIAMQQSVLHGFGK